MRGFDKRGKAFVPLVSPTRSALYSPLATSLT